MTHDKEPDTDACDCRCTPGQQCDGCMEYFANLTAESVNARRGRWRITNDGTGEMTQGTVLTPLDLAAVFKPGVREFEPDLRKRIQGSRDWRGARDAWVEAMMRESCEGYGE